MVDGNQGLTVFALKLNQTVALLVRRRQVDHLHVTVVQKSNQLA